MAVLDEWKLSVENGFLHCISYTGLGRKHLSIPADKVVGLGGHRDSWSTTVMLFGGSEVEVYGQIGEIEALLAKARHAA